MDQLPMPVPDHVVAVDTKLLPGTAIVVSGDLRRQQSSIIDDLTAAPDITDQASFNVVRSIVLRAKKLEGIILSQQKLACAPYQAVVDAIKALGTQYVTPLRLVQQEGKAQEAAFIVERDRKLAEAERDRLIAEAEAQNLTDRPTTPLVVQEAPEEFKAPVSYHDEVTKIDENLIPDEYWVIDMVRLRRDALAGKNIPGVTVEKVGRINAR